MRELIEPSDVQLKELYEAAVDFKKAEPWKLLYDTDIICVENPADGSIGYCSVMGKGGEHFALGVYLGDAGISGLYNMMENADEIPRHQMLHQQDCIMCSFEDRGQLESEDRNQIKALGLTFRGSNAWPMFRRYEPGYYPWFINQEECTFLTHALRQVLIVTAGLMSGELKLGMEKGKTILRYCRAAEDELEWESKEIDLLIPQAAYQTVRINDDVLIQKIKKAGRMSKVSLQIDICYMPSPVQENRGERPYFPRAYIMAECNSRMIADFEMYESIEDDVNVVLNKLISVCLDKGIPKEIQVRSERMTAILGDFCQKTGIKLKQVRHLSYIDEMMDEMAYRV